MQETVSSSAHRADERMRRKVAFLASAATLVLLIPFLAYRLSVADWTVSAVIVGVMVTMLVVMVFLRRGGSGLMALYVLVGVYSGGVVAVSYVLGFSGMLWLYPLVTANFYCLPRRSALAMNAMAVVAVGPQLATEPYLGIRIVATLGLVFMFGWIFSRQLEDQRHQLAGMALEDTLTGAGNRRALDLAIAQVRDASARYHRPASLVLLDLDHFKQVNDVFGHAIGDGVLSHVAQSLQARLRRSDRLFRYGGEEFVALLPETTADDAASLAEALRRACESLNVEAAGLSGDGIEQLTLSAGVAELAPGESVEGWLERADTALYRAKAGGRNQVFTAQQPAEGADGERQSARAP